jgi:hypothetical protein
MAESVIATTSRLPEPDRLRNGIYTPETACVFLGGSWADQFQPATFAARIALVSLLMISAKRGGLI